MCRSLHRQANKFSDYNFRDYAHRRIQSGFIESKNLSEAEKIAEQYSRGLGQLESLKRQTIVSSLYPEDMSVMESPEQHQGI